MKIKLILLSIFTIFSSQSYSQTLWQPLFNGENLDGWRTEGSQNWSVENGAVVARSSGDEMGWLIAENPHSNFVLRFRFKWSGGNSGIQVRSEMRDGKMFGVQANLDISRPNATGSVLEENGRGMLGESAINAETYFKKEEWNTYEIMVSGNRVHNRITTYVNGYKCADVTERNGLKNGFIALQMAPGEGGYVEFSDIRLLPLPDGADWEELYEPGEFVGWKPHADSTWEAQDDAYYGKSKDGGYGWLVSEKEYKDFYFVAEFKVPSGNSGIQFRSWVVDDMVHGFQADIDSRSDWINGHLYDQSERGILVKPDQDFSKIIDWNGWNTYEITAIGPKLELHINGVKSIEFEDPTRDKAGVFAFQIHSGLEMETWWRNMRIIEME